ncbi:metaxin-1-like [Tubulanus polymorphus]|uniref:metaxin-1-like n=1 Tax=Tubulanus polymorphus TaxID=672921 RepID=UPI003DA4EC26
MELEVWGCDWGLPSVDAACLTVMACCKFGEVPVKINQTNNPWRSPSGNLPVLRHNEKVISGVTEVCNYLREQNLITDYELTVKQSSETLAFQALLEEKLLPALLRIWWQDDRNFSDVTRPWFAKAVPFPQNFYYPVRKQSKCIKQFTEKMRINSALTPEDADLKVFRDAKECLNCLSHKLGDGEFFLGKNPTTLDALVYGYLAPLLKAPFPNNPLLNHLDNCDNLTLFCSRISQRYFPIEIKESEAIRDEKAKENKEDIMEFPHKYRNIVLAGLVAVTAMVGFAFMTGMVQIIELDDDTTDYVYDKDHMNIDEERDTKHSRN